MADDYEQEYTNEEYYDAMSDRERFEEATLKIHPFLPKRKVKLVTYNNTVRKGWISSTTAKPHIGKTGVVTEIHNNVHKAVKVKVDGSDSDGAHSFWHHLDLKLLEIKEDEPETIFFNPMDLVV